MSKHLILATFLLFFLSSFFIFPKQVFSQYFNSDCPGCQNPVSVCGSQQCSGGSVTCGEGSTNCSYTCTDCGGSTCSCGWGSWGSCDSSGYQARWCGSCNPNAYQIQPCGAPTPTPGPTGNGNTGTPGPTNPPSPSCTINLSPTTASISNNSTQALTASVVPSNGSVSSVNFSSNDTSVITVSPNTDTTSAYNTTAIAQTEGTTSIRVGVIMEGSERCSDTAVITVTEPDPWWQVQDADILTLGDLISLIPESLGTSLILPGLGGFPGIGVYGGTVADFDSGSGTGNISATGWIASSGSVLQKVFSYDYFESLVPADVVFNEITSTSISGSDLATGGTESRGYFWYRFDGTIGGTENQDLTISSDVPLGDRRVILLVKGANLNIEGDIKLVNGSGFFMTIVGKNASGAKGDIIVSPLVGGFGSLGDLEGIFFADSEFKTGTGDEQLYIRGAVAAYDGLVLERDLIDNSSTPAEFFEYALDQAILFPPSLSVRKIRWKEVAP